MASPDCAAFVNDVANPFSENEAADVSPVRTGFASGLLAEAEGTFSNSGDKASVESPAGNAKGEGPGSNSGA